MTQVAGLDAIDWDAPWLAPYRRRGERVAARVHVGLALPEALNAEREPALPVRFVPQSALPPDEPYEAFVRRTATVPTRENLHDFFNALVWLHLPRLKLRLNRLQAAEIARHGVGSVRGARRDALTLIDENGARLQAPPALRQALLQRDWQRLFVTERALWRDARLTLVGHALLEKLVRPYAGITAHVWLRGPLRRKPFAPLPVLGVPGWWAPNEDAAFYADTSVFRPAVGQSRR